MGKTAEQQAHKKSNAGKVVMLITALLAVAVIANWDTLIKVTSGERTLKGIIYGHSRRPDTMFYGWKMPEDKGSRDAKVTIEVFIAEGDGCHVPTLVRGQALGTIAPDRILLDFRNTAEEDSSARAREVKLGCEQGMAINGQVRFDLPQTDENTPRKGPKTMYLTAENYNWDSDVLYNIIDGVLEEAYDDEGFEISSKQFQGLMKIKTQVFQAKLEHEFKQRTAKQGAQE